VAAALCAGMSVLSSHANAADSVWTAVGSANWNDIGNWNSGTGPVPQFAGDEADFLGAIAGPSTVSLVVGVTVGAIDFNNTTNSYDIATSDTSMLALNNGPLSATITDDGGTHEIDTPLTLMSNTNLRVINPGDAITLTNNISGTGGLTVSGFGTVTLSGSNSYTGATATSDTIVKAGTLDINAAGSLPGGATVNNNSNLNIQAGNSTNPVLIGNLTGVGSLTIGRPQVFVGGTVPDGTVAASGYLRIAPNSGTNIQSSLTINPNATLDITQGNSLEINYGVGNPDPEATIRGYLKSAYNSGIWTGAGLTSSSVQAQVANAIAHGGGVWSIGYADGNVDLNQSIAAPGQIVVRPTLVGDTNMDGSVTFIDLGIVAQNLGAINSDWQHGDFNFDGTTNFLDIGLLAQNLSKTVLNTPLAEMVPDPSAALTAQWNLAVAEIQSNSVTQPADLPEPASIGVLALGAMGLMGRRRRR
jgi:autotransporter-associated beta strand protein